MGVHLRLPCIVVGGLTDRGVTLVWFVTLDDDDGDKTRPIRPSNAD